MISGMATLENLAVAKTIAMVLGGAGLLLLNFEISLGWASYHVKPLVCGGSVFGEYCLESAWPFWVIAGNIGYFFG
ncbi:MAG: hypothetical protein R2759_13030 [Bacteroidales bacterium]